MLEVITGKGIHSKGKSVINKYNLILFLYLYLFIYLLINC